MLSLAKARKDYYLQKLGEISPGEDYYLKGGTAPGIWHGNGATTLGLSGAVSAEQLVRLFDGEHPTTGQQLGKRLRKDGVAAFDVTFSADKSVSLLWALGGPEVRRHVEEAFHEATTEALVYLEREASATRGAERVALMGDDGIQLIDDTGQPLFQTVTWPIQTTGYVAARFTEYTSRSDDPQLHTHVVIANKVQGIDGTWRTLDGRNLYRHQLAAGYLHEAELRHRLTTRLGVRWQPVDKGMADIDGFTPEQLAAFSKRRAQIDLWRAAHGIDDTPAGNEAAALATRTKKHDRPIEELEDEWHTRAVDVGLTPDVIAGMLHHTTTPTLPNPDDVLDTLMGPDGLTHHDATFARPEMIVGIANHMPDGATRTTIETLADQGLQHPDILPVIPHTPVDAIDLPTPDINPGHEPCTPTPEPAVEPAAEPASDVPTEVSLAVERRYTTAELLETEQRVIDRAVSGVGAGRWHTHPAIVERTLTQYPNLTDGQQALVRQIATSGNAIDIGVGAAGTGKSAALSVVKALADRTDTPILGTALAARAAAGLQESTGITSTTITRLLGMAETDGLPHDAVVIVDEAGMVGTRHLAAISDQVEAAHGKLVVIGDHKQLPEIQAGGIFRTLTIRLPSVELTDNVRQVHPWERDALGELRDGSVSRAIAMYNRRGHIQTSPDPDKAITRAVDQWHRDVTDTGHPAGVLLIAHDNHTVSTLNTLARTRHDQAGHLTGPTLTIGELPLQAGDRVVCGRNSKLLGVNNGDLATITGVDPDARIITVSLDRGENVMVPDWYIEDGHLSHGYAVTGHKAQGATAQIAHTIVTDTISREWLYVTLSRGRRANTLHLITPDLPDDCEHIAHHTLNPHHALIHSLERSGAKHTALDHTQPNEGHHTAGDDGDLRRTVAVPAQHLF